ncbi:ArsR family transcriptional regulator [Paenibacillus sp. TY11]|uniref:ArsR family transcriptional regulator n=1 Tax=Paenibacillus sp. TY11 TaxID=3448633 RepID=UPI00403A45AB
MLKFSVLKKKLQKVAWSFFIKASGLLLLTGSHLIEELVLSQPIISSHLRLLRESGLVDLIKALYVCCLQKDYVDTDKASEAYILVSNFEDLQL